MLLANNYNCIVFECADVMYILLFILFGRCVDAEISIKSEYEYSHYSTVHGSKMSGH